MAQKDLYSSVVTGGGEGLEGGKNTGIVKAIANNVSDSAIASSGQPKKVPQYQNTSGMSTVDLQKMLVSKGYDIGASGVDGSYGPNTAAAYQKYQDDLAAEDKARKEQAAKDAEAARIKAEAEAREKERVAQKAEALAKEKMLEDELTAINSKYGVKVDLNAPVTQSGKEEITQPTGITSDRQDVAMPVTTVVPKQTYNPDKYNDTSGGKKGQAEPAAADILADLDRSNYDSKSIWSDSDVMTNDQLADPKVQAQIEQEYNDWLARREAERAAAEPAAPANGGNPAGGNPAGGSPAGGSPAGGGAPTGGALPPTSGGGGNAGDGSPSSGDGTPAGTDASSSLTTQTGYNPYAQAVSYAPWINEWYLRNGTYQNALADLEQQLAEERVRYNTDLGVRDLNASYQRGKQDYDRLIGENAISAAQAADNLALRNAANGDRGGIGAKLYSDQQANYDANLYNIKLEQINLKNQIDQQVADLISQGQYELANTYATIGAQRLENLQSLENSYLSNMNTDFWNVQDLESQLRAEQREVQSQKEAAAQRRIQMGYYTQDDLNTLGIDQATAERVADYYADQYDPMLYPTAQYKAAQAAQRAKNSGSGIGNSSSGWTSPYDQMAALGITDEKGAYMWLRQNGYSQADAEYLAPNFVPYLADYSQQQMTGGAASGSPLVNKVNASGYAIELPDGEHYSAKRAFSRGLEDGSIVPYVDPNTGAIQYGWADASKNDSSGRPGGSFNQPYSSDKVGRPGDIFELIRSNPLLFAN